MKAKYLMRILFLPGDLSVFQTGVSSLDGYQYGGSLWGSNLPCEERMENWGLLSFGEEAALGGDGDEPSLLTVVHSGKTRQQQKADKGLIQIRCKRKHFHCCLERLWCLCSWIFSRVGWVFTLNNLVCSHSWPHFRQDIGLETSWSSFQPELPYHPMKNSVHFWNTNIKIHTDRKSVV